MVCYILPIFHGKRVRHPSDALNVADEVKVVILKFDREKNRVSLGMKQIGTIHGQA